MELVHFTDLHYERDNPFQEELIRQLLIDIKRERDKGLSTDFLIFSGDLVKGPGDKNIYSFFEKDFLRADPESC